MGPLSGFLILEILISAIKKPTRKKTFTPFSVLRAKVQIIWQTNKMPAILLTLIILHLDIS